jgi:AcrR family transcriptional regulator
VIPIARHVKRSTSGWRDEQVDLCNLAHMARKGVAVRRDEIVLAALDQVRQRGIAGVRAAEVAKSLDVSTSLIFYHFGTLENLIVDAFRHAAEADLARLREIMAAGGEVGKRLRAVLDWYAPTSKADGWLLWIEAWAASLRDTELRSVAQRLDLRWREAVVALIAEGVGAGEFSCADPRAAAWRLTALLDGLAVQMVARDGAITANECTEWLEQALRHELGA